MALQDILNDLRINNAKSEGFYTTEQLIEIFNSASIDVPGAKANAITLTYSGPLDNSRAWQIVEAIGASSNGEVRTIGQTEVSELFKSREFRTALTKAEGSAVKADAILDGTKTNGIRNPDGLADIMSERFVLESKGPIIPFTPSPTEYGVWNATEFAVAMRSDAPSIGGIARESLDQLKTTLENNGKTAVEANKIALDYVNELSALSASKIQVPIDAEGKLITDASGKIASVGTKEFFNSLGMEGVGNELPAGQKAEYALDMKAWEARIMQGPEQFHNASLAHDIVTNNLHEQLANAHAQGNVVESARISESLNKANVAGMVIAFMTLASDAAAAELNGDSARAKEILTAGLEDFVKSALIFGGIEALGFLIGGPVGGLITKGVLVFGAYAAVSMVPALLDSIANLFTSAQTWIPRRDPLIFDLDNDGLETTGINTTNPLYFDHNADGVKTATGWVKSDDAFLVLDKNANGLIDDGRESKTSGKAGGLKM